MKKYKSLLSIIAIAAFALAMLTSCYGWYDIFDDPYGPPPPPPHHGYYHHHHHGHHRY